MVNQENVGRFIAEKRKEYGLTQEQLAEKLGVSNRSISRWENGKTMPDFSLFPKLCKILEVSISELLEGKGVTGESIHLYLDLLHYEEKKKQKNLNQFISGGILCGTLIWLHYRFNIFFFVEEITIFLGLLKISGILCVGAVFYYNNYEQKYTENEIKTFLGINQDVGMRTAKEMLWYARRKQKAELKQYEKGFQAIVEHLLPEEAVYFTMVAESLILNEGWQDGWKPWHIALAVTDTRILVSGESVRGRFMTAYDVEIYKLAEVVSIDYCTGKIIINLGKDKLTIREDNLEQLADDLKNACYDTVRRK